MAAPTVGATEVVLERTSGSSITIDKPTGVVSGDLMIVAFSTAGTTWSDDGGLPTGWALLANGEIGNAGSNDEYWLAYKVAGGSEPSNYTFGGGGANHSYVGSITRISGQDTDWSLGVVVTHRTTGTRDTSTRRTIADNTVILHFIFNENDHVTTEDGGYPSGTTGIYLKEGNQSGFGPSQGLAHETQATEGAATSRNWDTNFANTTTDHTHLDVYIRGDGESLEVPFPAEITNREFETDATNNIVLTAPAGTAEGDLLVAHVFKDQDGSTWTLPSGWTQEIVSTRFSIQTLIAYKEAGASEPGTYTFSLGTTSGTVYGGCIWRIPAGLFDTADPIDVSAANDGNDGTPTSPSVTTTVDNCLICRFSSNQDNANPGTFVGDFTQVYDEDTSVGSDAGLHGGYEWQDSAGATGTGAFDLTRTEDWAAVTIAIAPASAGPTTHLVETEVAGVGSVSAAGKATLFPDVAVAGVGAVVGNGLDINFAANEVAGVGSISARLAIKDLVAAAIAGLGDVTGTLAGKQFAGVSVDGVGALSPSCVVKTPLACSISGAGQVSAQAVASLFVDAAVAGVGSISANLSGGAGPAKQWWEEKPANRVRSERQNINVHDY